MYTLVWCFLTPFILVRLAWRARKQPAYLKHIAERFGFYNIKSNKPIIWIHAVSVGETRATQSLVNQLLQHYPEHQILLSHTTPTGRATSEQLFSDKIIRVYLPYDLPFATQHFLAHFKPQIGILMETEIWPNLIVNCHHQNIPLLLINGRMSEKSAQGYARFASLTRHTLQKLSAVAAQTGRDAERLRQLGAINVNIMGNLKFDITPPTAMLTLGQTFRQHFGTRRPIILIASSRDGEESLLLDHLSKLQIEHALIVIVPRHPQRFNEIADLLINRKLNFQRRSDNQPIDKNTKIVLGDSMGEMFAYYAAADLALIGGSWLKFGGQNLIESCAVGTPALFGPYMYNFAEASKLALEAGAAKQINELNQLNQEIKRLLGSETSLAEMKQQCLRFVAQNQGATNEALSLIQQYYKGIPLSSNTPSNNIELK